MTEHGRNEPDPPPAPATPEQTTEWLSFALEPLIARREELVEALKHTLAAHPRIDDDDTLADVAENMRMAATAKRTAKEQHDSHKRPHLENGRAVDRWFNSLLSPLDAAMAPVQATMDDYGRRKLASERARAEAAQRAAEAEAKQRMEAAAEAMLRNAPDRDARMDEAQASADRSQRAADYADARPADLTRVRGVYGATASMRESWGWEVTDMDAVPREYLMINRAKVDYAKKLRNLDGTPREIAGIRWIETHKMGVR